jgi:hypothetical protein
MKENKQDGFKATEIFIKENDKPGDMVPLTQTPFHKKHYLGKSGNSQHSKNFVSLSPFCNVES